MASNKTNFKGFTFKKLGSSSSSNIPPPVQPSRALPTSSGLRNAALSRSLTTAPKPKASNVSSPAKESTKSDVQTSIMAFAQRKVAVAASPSPKIRPYVGTMPLKPVAPKPSAPAASLFEALDDDDDDFELFDAAWEQEQSMLKADVRSKSPTFSPKPTPAATKEIHVIPDTPEKKIVQKRYDPQESNNQSRKRRRTSPVVDMYKEESSPRTNTHRSPSRPSPSKKSSSSRVDEDVCNQALLSRDLTRLSGEECTSLKDILLSVVNELCDIFCKIRTCDLMDLLSSDYERIQKLLTIRKQIKDSGIIKASFGSQSSRSSRTSFKSSTPIVPASSRAHSTSNNPSPLASFAGGSHSRVSSQDRKEETRNKLTSKLSLKSESPNPCGDSFFPTPTTVNMKSTPLSSNTNKSQMSNRLSFSSFPQKSMAKTSADESLACGQKTPGLTSRSNSFQSAAIPPLVSDSFMKDVASSQCSLDSQDLPSSLPISMTPSQDSKKRESDGYFDSDNDFDDEMEIAMAYDNDAEDFFEDEMYAKTPELKSPEKSKSGNVKLDDVHSISFSSHSQAQDKSEFDPEAFMVSDEEGDFGSQASVAGSTYVPKFSSLDRDDGQSLEFDGMSFPHSSVLFSMFRQVFGLSEFRHNQLQAINAALLGNDCFILMPTGGGKSLCYQLPALVSQGVSVIISPLKALITDQTMRLLSLDVPVASLSSDQDMQQQQAVYAGLSQRCPAYKMVYVTPEKVSASEKLLSCLDGLYNRQSLVRFVIDEAHCVSQWGHDFRPDYKRLNVLRQRFPGVPMMALTATATPRVRQDIVHQLGMTGPKWFMQTFNRPNLKYTVMAKKPKIAAQDLINFIKQKFPNESGIVYCLSRKECDDVASTLRRSGLVADQYHAGLDDGTRIRVQEKWLNDDGCKIICATIAFGMGIDKANVRFVVHYSLPKSMEGYYQEAGRAGRDGQLAHCILFYSYQDVKRWRRIIEMDKSASFESRRVHNDNLYRMVHYCENVTDCRRSQVLHYLGEQGFERSMCHSYKGAACDNCLTKDCFNVTDVTADAKEIVKCVKELNTGRYSAITLIHILEIFKGSLNTKVKSSGHDRLPLHGRGKQWARQDAERLCRKLVIDGILKEDLKLSAQEHTLCYVKLGPKALDLMQNKIKVELPMQGTRRLTDVNKGNSEAKNEREKMELKCLDELRGMAKTIAAEYNVKNYTVIFPESALKQLAQRTPITITEMIDQIDHFNATIIDKYRAERLLEITLKYSMEFDDLGPDLIEEDPDDSSQFDMDNASRYWEEPSSSSSSFRGRSGGGRGRGRGGKKSFKKKKKRGGSSGRKSTRGKSAGRKSSTKATSSFPSQASSSSSYYNSKPSATSSYSGGGGGGMSRNTSGVTKANLGLMPDPRSRPFLCAKKSFMG